jgi:hypothetical protein
MRKMTTTGKGHPTLSCSSFLEEVSERCEALTIPRVG